MNNPPTPPIRRRRARVALVLAAVAAATAGATARAVSHGTADVVPPFSAAQQAGDQ